MTLIQLIGGLALLVVGAELLVRSATSLARLFGVSSLVIGLTVVAFGTGAPELAVGVYSSLNGQSNIAIGNVVGSNIINVLFILGISAAIAPLFASKQLIRLDVPVMIVVSGVTFLFALSGAISRTEGGILFLGLVIYTVCLIVVGRKDKKATEDPELPIAGSPSTTSTPIARKWPVDVVMLLVGLGMLVFGSNLLVGSAITIANHLGISESIIGLTIVAGGTSLPELVTSIVASIKGERDLAVGNVVGSNIFNMLGVLGISAFVSPDGLPVLSSVLHFDFPVMLVAAFVCLPIFFTGGTIARWEGILLFGFYVAFTVYLILAAGDHDSIEYYETAMQYFVFPLTAITLTASLWSSLRQRKASS